MAMVDAGPARRHVKDLVARGMRQQDIADAAPVTMAALGILLHGHYAPGRPPQLTINQTSARALLAVQFKPRPAYGRTTTAAPRCVPTEDFERAGYHVGRCNTCGELAPVRTTDAPGGWRTTLVAHPTITATREQPVRRAA